MELKLKQQIGSKEYNSSYESLMTIMSEVIEEFLSQRITNKGQEDLRSYLMSRFAQEYSMILKADIKKVLQRNLLAWHKEQESWRLK